MLFPYLIGQQHMSDQTTHQLEFAEKYNEPHAKAYFYKHTDGLARKLSNWRDQQIARKALKIAGDPLSVLDVPCGTGRFWKVLTENSDRIVYASDNSQKMIDIGLQYRDKQLTKKIQTSKASAFSLPVSDGYVDTIFCIRLLHHIGDAEDRLELLKEFYRVTKSTVIISLWVDGNFKAWRRKKLESSRTERQYQNRFVIPRHIIEKEFNEAGFRIKAYLDFLPKYAMWRTYILEKDENMSC
ncbi:class I SAM-dependent methyltransferase [Methylophaga sp.]|uniref:class I SAM-dependent methyltransferase n=1 Tax=Methylophaga sp. TaxID=2024840 RepID=UPI00271AFDF8|nr:class I SAM-dependent methyltransferase [Methylophaga sp.]MDO8827456.1 class I SAM-dependent methyltransferase [Methylophaga sp.]